MALENDIGMNIKGVTCDSRQVKPGYIFAALPGTNADGRSYIADAIVRGAVAVISLPSEEGIGIPVLASDNPRLVYAHIAAKFYGSQPENLVAVTGTNGKTSVAAFTRQIWAALGHKSASMGTIGVEISGFDKGKEPRLPELPALTTPDPADLHCSLAAMAQAGINHLALEASSHGLDQYRLDGTRIKAAAYTNLSRDHLDYHGDMSSYLASKTRLFTDILSEDGTAVVNADDQHSEAIIESCWAKGQQVIRCGYEGEEIRLLRVTPEAHGQLLEIDVFGSVYEIQLPLVGDFQVSNALIALGLVLAGGENAGKAVACLENLEGVNGRVERVGSHPNGAAIYVDFAHTPGALASILSTLRPHTTGMLRIVFGCGGDRDAGKRPEMGQIAAELADDVIVTDDNPRTEDPEGIRAEVMVNCPEASNIGDREEAIRDAINRLDADDILVVAGKGHETGQIIGDQVREFRDQDVILNILEELNP